MAHLSNARIACAPPLRGLELVNRGKVRDTYLLKNPYQMLVEVTDGISIFDFVLNATIPEKGMVLTALSHFWFKMLESYNIPTHFIAAGAEIDGFLPEYLRGNPEIQSRAMVVQKLRMANVEFVARGYLTGSGFKDYTNHGSICGHILPPGLQDGDKLPFVLDTPTTKANEGHDIPLFAPETREQFPEEIFLLLQIYQIIASHAEKCGVILADTKLKFGRDLAGRAVLADEVGTPDSSRYWSLDEWRSGQYNEIRKVPEPLDKQLVREWGIEKGINELDPKNPDHIEAVQKMELPDKIKRKLNQTYRYIFWRLTGSPVDAYFRTVLRVPISEKMKRVAILLGSESDIKKCELEKANYPITETRVSVISCHRHPELLENFAKEGCGGADVVVAVGGKAFALPGVLDAMLHQFGYNIPVIGVAVGENGSRELEAAKLSISELPDQPVIMDEVNGNVYVGPDGLRRALARVAYGELPPPKKRTIKEPVLNFQVVKY